MNSFLFLSLFFSLNLVYGAEDCEILFSNQLTSDSIGYFTESERLVDDYINASKLFVGSPEFQSGKSLQVNTYVTILVDVVMRIRDRDPSLTPSDMEIRTIRSSVYSKTIDRVVLVATIHNPEILSSDFANHSRFSEIFRLIPSLKDELTKSFLYHQKRKEIFTNLKMGMRIDDRNDPIKMRIANAVQSFPGLARRMYYDSVNSNWRSVVFEPISRGFVLARFVSPEYLEDLKQWILNLEDPFTGSQIIDKNKLNELYSKSQEEFDIALLFSQWSQPMRDFLNETLKELSIL